MKWINCTFPISEPCCVDIPVQSVCRFEILPDILKAKGSLVTAVEDFHGLMQTHCP